MKTSPTTRPSNLRRILFILLLVAIFLALPSICRVTDDVFPRYGHLAIESIAELDRIRRELPLAEKRWKAHNILDYEIDATAIVLPTFCHDINDLNFTVWDLDIQSNEIFFDNDIQKNYVEECNIGDFLPPKVFYTISHELKIANPLHDYMRVEFDPVYGYVSRYYSDYVWYPGGACADCMVEYRFSNFRPKKP